MDGNVYFPVGCAETSLYTARANLSVEMWWGKVRGDV